MPATSQMTLIFSVMQRTMPYLSARIWVRSQASQCGIFGRQSGNGHVFLQVLWYYPVSIISPVFDTRLPIGSERGQPHIRAGFFPYVYTWANSLIVMGIVWNQHVFAELVSGMPLEATLLGTNSCLLLTGSLRWCRECVRWSFCLSLKKKYRIVR